MVLTAGVEIFTAWLKDNWFPLVQGIGIIGGLLSTAVAVRQSTKARRVSDWLALSEHHRELWNEVQRRPELGRIFQGEVDLLAHPISVVEERFLNEVILQFHTGWQFAREGGLLRMDELARDARWFFELPIPRSVWKQTRFTRDERFVRFIEDVLDKLDSRISGSAKRELFRDNARHLK